MLLYKFSAGETLGVSAGKLWVRLSLFDGSGRLKFTEKYLTNIMDIPSVDARIHNMTDIYKSSDEELVDRIINQIKKASEQ